MERKELDDELYAEAEYILELLLDPEAADEGLFNMFI